MFDDIIAIIDYVSSDQEKEGRELGIKKATSMYKPILESLELKQKKLIKELDDESISFSSKAELLKQSVMNIECETEKWKNNMRLNRSYSKFSTIIKENKSGGSILYGAISMGWDGHLVADWLNKKMDQKRIKYFEIEFNKQEAKWVDKINNVEKEITSLKNKLKKLTYSDKEAMEKLLKIHEKAVQEYANVYSQYQALLIVEGDL